MTEIDDSLIGWLAGEGFNEDFQYQMKVRELKKDFRLSKDRYTDINGQYKNFASFQNTDEYKNTVRARALLSEQWDTSSDSLRETLMSTYKMCNQDVDQVMRNLGNSKDIECHRNNFNNSISLRRRIL